MNIDLVAIVVDEYDPADRVLRRRPRFRTRGGFGRDHNKGQAKRWVVVRPPHSTTGILLAKADGAEQAAVVGRQVADRVGFFLRVDDFDAAFRKMAASGVDFLGEPRSEVYGRVAVFRDIAGNKWDLLGD